MSDDYLNGWLYKNFTEVLLLPEDATKWLVSLFEVTQFFDDLADGDSVDRVRLNRALWDVLVEMPKNNFFRENSQQLTPLVGTQILKWQASDKSEREGNADAKSFAWRAGYYDIVLYVTAMIHGVRIAEALAENVLRLYGETLENYILEFKNA